MTRKYGLPEQVLLTPREIEVVILIGKDLTTTGRTLENLGLAGMNSRAIQQFLETGKKT